MARCVDANQGRLWLAQLAEQRRLIELPIPARGGTETRWVMAEYAAEYRAAFGLAGDSADALASAERVLRRLLAHSGPLTGSAMLARYAFHAVWLDATLSRLVDARAVTHGHFTRGATDDEFCDQRNLEQIHRRTLTILRKAVQPVPLPVYAALLSHWQHAAPDERLSGQDGLQQVMRLMRGVALMGRVWEQDALPLRLRRYKPADLDVLCERGDPVWAGSGRDPRRARLRFFARSEGALFVGPADESNLSETARAVRAFLQAEGASFVADVQAGLKLAPRACEDPLTELAMAGLVTNDAMGVVRRMMAGPPADGSRQPWATDSALETELTERMGRPASSSSSARKPSSLRLREAHRRATERLSEGQCAPWGGRWSLVHRPGVLGSALDEEGQAGALARVYLERYGMLMRECLEREDAGAEWSQLYPALQRMEMRGAARRGYFVLRRALQAYLIRPHAPRHMLVTQWNGRPVSGTEGSELLRDLGFYRVPAGIEWWSQV